MSRLRIAGSKWRLLVHGDRDKDGMFNMSHHIAHDRDFGYSGKGGYDRIRERLGLTDDHGQAHEFPGTEFDELVVGHAIHIEKMDTGRYWMNVAGVTIWLTMDRDGRPKSVTVYGPNDYDAPSPNCSYECTWSDEQPLEES